MHVRQLLDRGRHVPRPRRCRCPVLALHKDDQTTAIAGAEAVVDQLLCAGGGAARVRSAAEAQAQIGERCGQNPQT
ncbi:hypothetical protein AB4Z54_43170, partial [Streptomyces sp. MCAF7]